MAVCNTPIVISTEGLSVHSQAKFSGREGVYEASIKEFTFPNVWEKESFPEFSRLKIGSRDHEVNLILDLCRSLNGPFGILFVLLTSRIGNEPARYQSPEPIGFDELELFLKTFQEFIEQDGRHAVWVSSLSGEGQFIFDQHNFIYAYGNLDRITSQLSAAGYVEGGIQIPVPHSHNYHAQFDDAEDHALRYWQWLKSPLGPDDNP